MPRLRVYIETSVWSFVFAEDAPDFHPLRIVSPAEVSYDDQSEIS